MKEIDLQLEPLAMLPPWDTVIQLADVMDKDAWLLVGGLMVQAHAVIAGRESRATQDIDMLINILADGNNLGKVYRGLQSAGFSFVDHGLRGFDAHRFSNNGLVVDVLIADHLPTRRKAMALINSVPLMEMPGGAQAIERRIQLNLHGSEKIVNLCIPDLLGALVLKAAAFIGDGRNGDRHLDDIALLSSLITEHAIIISQLRGSDRRRLLAAKRALADPNHRSWLKMSEDERIAGQDTLRIITG
jgi:hypothetical protein